jgi:glycosyltransferase involved in cell wall biosynthesis
MKYSIIIPTYNRANLVGKTILSALDQKHDNFEVIVVDDGSSDNTKEVVEQIKDSRLFYYRKENGERGAARNYGALRSTGDYLNFLDSDDIVFPNHISEADLFIASNNSPEVFYQAAEVVVAGKAIKKHVDFNKGINEILMYGNPLPLQGVFIRRDVALANTFNENRAITASEDWELWLRLSTKYRILYNDVVTSNVIDHEQRSVVNLNKEFLIKSKEAFVHTVISNNEITKAYRNKIKAFIGSNYSYVSLHLLLNDKYRLLAVKYLLKSIAVYPAGVFTRRFLAIIKHLV